MAALAQPGEVTAQVACARVCHPHAPPLPLPRGVIGGELERGAHRSAPPHAAAATAAAAMDVRAAGCAHEPRSRRESAASGADGLRARVQVPAPLASCAASGMGWRCAAGDEVKDVGTLPSPAPLPP